MGPDNGSLLLHTKRDGVAGGLGHDLTIEVTSWQAEVVDRSAVTVTVDLRSLVVREGVGGALSLIDADRRDILRNAAKTLRVDDYPSGRYESVDVRPVDGGYQVDGNLTLAGATHAVPLQVTETAEGHYLVTATVRQSDFGIRPYSAFFGALKVRDEVTVSADVTVI